LEFLTDQQVLDKGIDKQTYQYSLLNVSKKGTSVGLSNQFNFKLLKRRIMMMNKKRSSKIELSKYAFLLPVFLLTGAAFTVSKAEGSIEG
jgi:beta-lactamase regulating signal transducer with metallopeptidase domain